MFMTMFGEVEVEATNLPPTSDSNESGHIFEEKDQKSDVSLDCYHLFGRTRALTPSYAEKTSPSMTVKHE